MFTNVVVGIDEETRGRDAIALAQRLAARDAELTFVHVHPGFPATGKGSNGEFDRAMRDDAFALLRSVAAETGIRATLCAKGSYSVGAGLHQIAEELHADVLVVGSTPRGRLGRVYLGDMTSQALNGAPCAVAIAPSGYAEHADRIAEIGIAYNGSEESLHAVGVARELAQQAGAQLSAFEALDSPLLTTPVSSWRGVQDESRQEVATARMQIASLGPDITPHAASGDPVKQLSIYSDSVDLLIVGSRGYGPVGRLVHGTTTRRLARVARSPLLILTRVNYKPDGAASKVAAGSHEVVAH